MKLPVMKFELDNDTIVDAIRAAVEVGGVSLEGKYVRVNVLAKRKGAGLSATVEVSSDPFLEAEPKAPSNRGRPAKNKQADAAVADQAQTETVVTETVEAEADAVVAETAKTAGKKKGLFGDETAA